MACNTEPDSRYVIAIGAAALDEYYTADTWPSEGGKAMVDYKEDMIGGMIPNAACVFAGYGVHTYLVDTLKNNSKKTDMIVSDLKAHGVKTGLLRYQDDIPDARTIIILTHRERTILVVEPHKPLLDIKACELDIFRKASYIYTTPVELKNIRNYMEFVDDMKNHHVKLAFDIEASTVDACDKELIYKGDVLFFNEFGFEKIKGNRGEEEAFSEMFENGVEIATITLGEKGSFTAKKTKPSGHLPSNSRSLTQPVQGIRSTVHSSPISLWEKAYGRQPCSPMPREVILLRNMGPRAVSMI